jgi:hypothetical protein
VAYGWQAIRYSHFMRRGPRLKLLPVCTLSRTSADGAALCSFHEADHGTRDGSNLRGYHREALRLWLKGARLVPRPITAVAKTLNTGLATGKRNDYTATTLSAAGRKSGSRESALVQ